MSAMVPTDTNVVMSATLRHHLALPEHDPRVTATTIKAAYAELCATRGGQSLLDVCTIVHNTVRKHRVRFLIANFKWYIEVLAWARRKASHDAAVRELAPGGDDKISLENVPACALIISVTIIPVLWKTTVDLCISGAVREGLPEWMRIEAGI